MAIVFPSDAWIKAVKDVLNADAEYGQIAHNWEGDIVLVVEADSAGGRPVYLYLDLWHGRCRQAYELRSLVEKKPAFTLSATRSVFVQIVQGKLDPIQAMLSGPLKISGSLVYIKRNVPAVLKFVQCTQKVETEFSVGASNQAWASHYHLAGPDSGK